MDQLTTRQIEILNAIITEYTETGEPVGSEILEKKYRLGVSPATIRNEMVVLAKLEYLKKSHFSSGRIPSAKGYRFYIQNLMKEKQLSTLDEVTYKNSLWDDRADIDRLLAHGTKLLAQKTGLIAISATSEGHMHSAGSCNIFNHLNVLDMIAAQQICSLLDEYPFWQQVMQRYFAQNHKVFYLLGEEDFYDPIFEPAASIIGDFKIGGVQGVIGLLGPKRMKFDVYVPQVRYFSKLLEDIAQVT